MYKMEQKDIPKVITDIIDEIIDEPMSLDKLDFDVPLRDQMDLDSMDFLDIVMELRKQYCVEVPEAEYGKLSTMNGCIDYLKDKL